MHKILLSILLLAFFSQTTAQSYLYRILGLNTHATDEEVKKACKQLMLKHHPDKGGKPEAFQEIAHACQELRAPKTARNSFKQPADDNNCSFPGQHCKCPRADQEGTCRYGILFKELYCQCTQARQTEDSFFSKFQEADYKTFFENFFKEFFPIRISEWFIISRTINSPIYSLALDQTLLPYHVRQENEGFAWRYAIAPFGKTKEHAFDGKFEQTEGGIISNCYLGYNGWYLELRTLLSIYSSKFEFEERTDSHSSLDVRDALLFLGTHQTLGSTTLSLKGIFGCSLNRAHKELIFDRDTCLHVPHLCAGIQTDAFLPISQNDTSKYTAISTLRWLHFFKTHITLLRSVSFRRLDELHNSSLIDTLKTEPGSFVDVLLGLDTQYGLDYEHHIQMGYNATIDIEPNSHQPISLGNDDNELLIHHLRQPATRHTFYTMYTYDFSCKDAPASFSLGFSASFAQKTHANTLKPGTGLVWLSIALSY